MCGIVGFSGKPDNQTLDKMTQSIFHRGPDDGGRVVNDNFSVGYRRLAIIDLTMGLYPLTNEDKTIQVMNNGEIYNYQALREELEELGHKFSSESDTEVIAHGYEEWGEKVVNHLRGMFVIVLYNKNKDELFIARDRLGIKPLYYTQVDGRVVFGSEIKGLLSGFNINREVDQDSLYKFLTARIHDTNQDTFFKNIKRLLPGHYMVINNTGKFQIEKYWNPTYSTKFSSEKSDAEYSKEFRDIFIEAIKLHLIADVPVGVTLSGGLDSSGITSIAAKLYKENHPDTKLYSFSAVHPGETINEEEYIDNIVEATGVESIKMTPNVDNFWNEMDNWVYFQEEPVISTAPYAYYTVMREARKHVTVLLTGQGGDELLAGYIPYFMTYLQSAIDNGKVLEAFRETVAGKDLYTKFFVDKLIQKLKKENTINPNQMIVNTNNTEFIRPQATRNLNKRLFEDVTSLTTPSLLRYEDKNSMANSLESRVPFFDHMVVEYIFNLPIDQKIKNGWTRHIYREAMKGLIPEKNRLRRSKIGFTNPEWEWIERRQQKFIDVFESDTFKSRPFWKADLVLQSFKLALENKIKGDVLFFWRVFITEMWMRTYVDKFEVLDTKSLVNFRN